MQQKPNLRCKKEGGLQGLMAMQNRLAETYYSKLSWSSFQTFDHRFELLNYVMFC